VRLRRIPDDLAGEAGPLADDAREIANRELFAAAEIHGLAAVVLFGSGDDSIGGVFDVEKLARRRAVAPQDDFFVAALFRFDELPDHRGDDVARLEIEVVARTVEIHRQQEDAVEAVLIAICLELHEQRFLRDAVRRVGLFGIAIPQLVFFERDVRELRIGADGSELHEFFDAGEPRFFDELNAHDRVLVEEAAGMFAIRADAADDGRTVNDEIRFIRREERARCGGIAEVELFRARRENRRRVLALQPFADEAAEKAAAAGEEDAFVSPEAAQRTASGTMRARPSASASATSASTMRSTS